MHGSEVIHEVLLPIGLLSEEAQEARNKYFRLYREKFSRKFSRVSCNTDILNRLLLKSDPVMTGMRKQRRKTSRAFQNETLSLLKCVEPNEFSSEDEDEEE